MIATPAVMTTSGKRPHVVQRPYDWFPETGEAVNIVQRQKALIDPVQVNYVRFFDQRVSAQVVPEIGERERKTHRFVAFIGQKRESFGIKRPASTEVCCGEQICFCSRPLQRRQQSPARNSSAAMRIGIEQEDIHEDSRRRCTSV